MGSKKVALVTGYGWAGVTVSLAMCIEYLYQKGYDIDVFIDKDHICDGYGLNQPLFDVQKANVVFFEKPNIKGSVVYEQIAVTKANDAFFQFVKMRDCLYDFYVGFDIDGLVRSGLCALEQNRPFFYFSLEFYEVEDESKVAERFFANKAWKIFTQDRFRAALLSDMLDVPLDKLNVVYNTTIGNPIVEKSSWLRQKFPIKENQKIVLCIGTLMGITGVDKIIQSAVTWSEKYVLVLHGWIPEQSIAELISSSLKRYPQKIFYSSQPLQHDDKFNLFSSADFGLIYYRPDNLNLKYAAWSSGKFFDFCRCAVPVVGNNIPNMHELIEDNGCGMVLDDFMQLEESFDTIDKSYQSYLASALQTFEKYDLMQCLDDAFKDVIYG